MTYSVVVADCLTYMRGLPAQSVDLVFGSPPYEGARLYLENGEDLGIARKTEAWVAWMVEVFKESLRVCRGLVAFVVEGQTRKFRYTAGPALLMADLHRAGIHLRKPPIFHRVGIPGSGGPDWWRNDAESIICATNGGKLPWSDNTACGHPPKWAPGGEMSYRTLDGSRVNIEPDRMCDKGGNRRRADGTREAMGKKAGRRIGRGYANGDTVTEDAYFPPMLANPGNVIQETYTAGEVAAMLNEQGDVAKYNVGGGVMGNKLCHKNEAPFPEDLAERFIRSFCPPGGVVLDPFTGSGTTGAVAVRWGRSFLGCDLRPSQVENALLRISGETPAIINA